MKLGNWIRAIILIGCSLAAVVHAIAKPPANAAFVPVEHATFHHLVFADSDVAILNVYFPPKGDSGFHTHSRDLFGVVIQPSTTSSQDVGEALESGGTGSAGDASYGAIEPKHLTHRVVNDGDGPRHLVVTELRRAKPLGTGVSTREAAPQYARIVDNRRLRAWRLILQPGESAPAITQRGKGVRVVVRGGLLTTTMPGLGDQQLVLRAGDFAVQPAGAARALKNTGTEPIELVELELK